MKDKMKDPNDIAVFFFAGHGSSERDSFYLLPYDAKKDNLGGTALLGDTLSSMLENARSVIVMLDACHSGNVHVGKFASERSRVDGMIVMCSSTGGELSIESSDLRHGFFTQAILEGLDGGLKGKATDLKGEINHRSLYAYVEIRVQELSENHQNPQNASAGKTSIRLTKPTPKP